VVVEARWPDADGLGDRSHPHVGVAVLVEQVGRHAQDVVAPTRGAVVAHGRLQHLRHAHPPAALR